MDVALPDGRASWAVSSPLHNKLNESDRPVHAWYRFVLSFPPHLVRDYLSDFAVKQSATVLDPFCGTGTTLVEAKKLGVGSVGIEANPIAAFASKVKTNWGISPDDLLLVAQEIANNCEKEFHLEGMEFGKIRAREVSERRTLFGLRSLPSEAERLLLKGSISPLPLHRCLTLREAIAGSRKDVRDHLLLALAWVVVNEAGNVRFGPEVGITKPKDDAPVVDTWLNQVRRIAADIEAWQLMAQTPSKVIGCDSRRTHGAIPDNSISAVFTSPPYPNEKDYTRTTRLESVILGLVNNRAELRQLKESLLRSNTRNVFAGDSDDTFVDDVPEIQRICEAIEKRRVELGKDSGFERLYHRVTKLYFGGMTRHLAELRRVLRPGAMLGYVVGDQASYLRVLIRTGRLLEGIATRLGYEHVRTDLFRTRLATATREQLREEVVVLRWNG